jgi:hypothetical protein
LPWGFGVKGFYALKPWYSRRLGGITAYAVRRWTIGSLNLSLASS